ncbi:MAG: restriction endonuclease [Candidatus Nitrohelix vancouverensis]|uniref:Restriction endonuclease n=1 Tax=Candidatus Nitrohelix vancouverensis TaxID=2705534 RepID=A0A7T0C3V0_9BACT|nr:MAG: restriction endonuclease [Candidatus Nitrohelix vancouverensis]
MGIFIIAFVAFAIGIVLIVFLKNTSPPPPPDKVHFDNPDDKPVYLIDPDEFKSKCIEFLEKFNLEYRHSVWASDSELEIAMQDETPVIGGVYLGLCIINPYNNTVDSIKVKGFIDTVKGEGASRGILITTGYFSADAMNVVDEEPVELVDVLQFLTYLKRFEIY